eukprot:jgi/Tetstr1/462196/TSEL_007259.t1
MTGAAAPAAAERHRNKDGRAALPQKVSFHGRPYSHAALPDVALYQRSPLPQRERHRRTRKSRAHHSPDDPAGGGEPRWIRRRSETGDPLRKRAQRVSRAMRGLVVAHRGWLEELHAAQRGVEALRQQVVAELAAKRQHLIAEVEQRHHEAVAGCHTALDFQGAQLLEAQRRVKSSATAAAAVSNALAAARAAREPAGLEAATVEAEAVVAAGGGVSMAEAAAVPRLPAQLPPAESFLRLCVRHRLRRQAAHPHEPLQAASPPGPRRRDADPARPPAPATSVPHADVNAAETPPSVAGPEPTEATSTNATDGVEAEGARPPMQCPFTGAVGGAEERNGGGAGEGAPTPVALPLRPAAAPVVSIPVVASAAEAVAVAGAQRGQAGGGGGDAQPCEAAATMVSPRQQTEPQQQSAPEPPPLEAGQVPSQSQSRSRAAGPEAEAHEGGPPPLPTIEWSPLPAAEALKDLHALWDWLRSPGQLLHFAADNEA